MQRLSPTTRIAPVLTTIQRSIRLLPRLAIALMAVCAAQLHAQDRSAVHKVPPVYPPIAKQMGITGVVVVNATVDASGKVIKAESSSGNKLLAPSAIEAVKQWKFAPGEATDTLAISVNFDKS